MDQKILFLLLSIVVITKLVQYKVDAVKCYKNEKPLYDVFHEKMPNLKKYEKAVDFIPYLLALVVLYMYIYDGLNEQLINDLMLNYAILMILRVITFSITILPSPICSKRSHPLAMGGCRDMIFSGHVTSMLLLAYTLYKHNPQYETALILYCTIGSLLIIATRSHYTIDVIVAYIAVYAVLK